MLKKGLSHNRFNFNIVNINNTCSKHINRVLGFALKLRNRYPGTYPLFTPTLKKMGVLERVVIG
ncbi:hypothetical protein C7M60_03920 [Clostridium botulinum]|nr:hypothetical protein C7M60_03920 [Clostridium botulinum]AVQ49047.1 hypothetical protein C7M58_06730 [Clostridium botulinum]